MLFRTRYRRKLRIWKANAVSDFWACLYSKLYVSSCRCIYHTEPPKFGLCCNSWTKCVNIPVYLTWQLGTSCTPPSPRGRSVSSFSRILLRSHTAGVSLKELVGSACHGKDFWWLQHTLSWSPLLPPSGMPLNHGHKRFIFYAKSAY
jgi:hypothetical protein